MTMSFTPSPVSLKLAKISEVMSDGVHFIKIRLLVEEWDSLAASGDARAQEFMKTVDIFHRLCTTVQNSNESLF